MNIVLVGFMGTGKTAVAKRLAEKLDRRYVCMDDIIEEKAGKPISRIFAEDGEPAFRDIESKVAEEVGGYKDAVIDAGGGVVLEDKNIENLKKNGVMICLEAAPELIFERVKDESHRPLLQVEKPMDRIRELLKFREPFYKKADISIDTSSMGIDEVAERIKEVLGEAKGRT